MGDRLVPASEIGEFLICGGGGGVREGLLYSKTSLNRPTMILNDTFREVVCLGTSNIVTVVYCE